MTLHTVYNLICFPRFTILKKWYGGMLPPKVYHKIYKIIKDLPDLDIVEIGGASGACSITVAKAMKASGKKGKLIVVEKYEGGSRSSIGNYELNYSYIIDNFRRAGVDEYISLFPHEITYDNTEKIYDLIKTSKISCLIHDADGRIDRDINLLFSYLCPKGIIIVDDYINKAKYKVPSKRYQIGGIKKKITYHLVNQLVDWGLIIVDEIIGDTLFGHKGKDDAFKNLDISKCEIIVKNIEIERDKILNIKSET